MSSCFQIRELRQPFTGKRPVLGLGPPMAA